MPAAPATIGETEIDGLPALTLSSSAAGGIEAAFVPEAGMVGCSLRHRGEELLGQRGGLARYVSDRSTMGIPFLHPWANRLGANSFEIAGREIRLDRAGTRLKRDEGGLPIHGLLAAARGWVIERHSVEADAAVLAASFDFGAHDDLLAAFPFPHVIQIEVRLEGAALTVATTVSATGGVAVPIAFGFHPYFSLPGIDRGDWEVEMPVRERLLLDERMLPTGGREAAAPEAGPLGSRTFADAYVAPPEGAPFVLAGGGRRIEVSFGEGYAYAQVYAPADDALVAFEPMTAPTNALIDDEGSVASAKPGEPFTATFTVGLID
jgi:galactose mutarotase-like enzyme